MPIILFAAWFLIAVAVATSELLKLAHPAVVPAIIGTLLVLLLVAWRRLDAVRKLIARVDVRVLVALHIVRAPIGLAFLWFHSRGLLPADFAVRGGIGDIVAGLLALVVVVVPRPRWLAAWNIIGLLDLVMVVITAQRHILFGDPTVMAPLVDFPFAMLPLFVVPLMLGTHVMLFTRFRG